MTDSEEQSFGYLFPSLPDGLRSELVRTYNNIIRNYRERRWEPAELNGGKLSEVVYSILRGHADGKFPDKPSKPRNFVEACRQLESIDRTRYSRSIRIHIPRVLISLYEFRNNRNVGHVGGDVDPNHMDAALVVQSSKWVVAELIRIFHDVEAKIATETVEAMTDRLMPLVWTDGRIRRVLDPNLPFGYKALILLYQDPAPIDCAELCSWVEYSNLSVFRKRIIQKYHKEKKVEYYRSNDSVQILPPGEKFVEDTILLHQPPFA